MTPNSVKKQKKNQQQKNSESISISDGVRMGNLIIPKSVSFDHKTNDATNNILPDVVELPVVSSKQSLAER